MKFGHAYDWSAAYRAERFMRSKLTVGDQEYVLKYVCQYTPAQLRPGWLLSRLQKAWYEEPSWLASNLVTVGSGIAVIRLDNEVACLFDTSDVASGSNAVAQLMSGPAIAHRLEDEIISALRHGNPVEVWLCEADAPAEILPALVAEYEPEWNARLGLS